MKKYIEPEVEITFFSSQDIITISGVDDSMEDWGEELDGSTW